MLAAFLSVLADLEWPAIVGITALAWAIAAVVETLAWQPGTMWSGMRRSAAPSLPPSPVVYAEPPAGPPQDVEPVRETPAESPSLQEPEPSPPEPVGAGLVAPAPAEDEPAAKPESVGAGLVQLAPTGDEPTSSTEPEPVGAGDAPPVAPDEPAAPPRERRSWLGQMRRRPSAPEPPPEEPPTPPKREPEPPSADAEAEDAPERPQLRAVEPGPETEPPPAAPPPPPDTSVVRMSSRRAPEPREWNLWDLESLAREEARSDPARRDEWSYLFLHLRQFADAKGTLPSDFDALVRESFGDLLEARDLV